MVENRARRVVRARVEYTRARLRESENKRRGIQGPTDRNARRLLCVEIVQLRSGGGGTEVPGMEGTGAWVADRVAAGAAASVGSSAGGRRAVHPSGPKLPPPATPEGHGERNASLRENDNETTATKGYRAYTSDRIFYLQISIIRDSTGFTRFRCVRDLAIDGTRMYSRISVIRPDYWRFV